jgi:hypothetical protein
MPSAHLPSREKLEQLEARMVSFPAASNRDASVTVERHQFLAKRRENLPAEA